MAGLYSLESLGYGSGEAPDSAPVVKKKPRGRPRKIAEGSPVVAPAPTSKTPAERKAQTAASAEVARAVVGTTVGAMIALVGPEWDFESQQESDGVKGAVAAYIDAKGDGKVTPETMLLLVVAGYALPRTAHQNTRDKLGAFFGGLWSSLKTGVKALIKG